MDGGEGIAGVHELVDGRLRWFLYVPCAGIHDKVGAASLAYGAVGEYVGNQRGGAGRGRGVGKLVCGWPDVHVVGVYRVRLRVPRCMDKQDPLVAGRERGVDAGAEVYRGLWADGHLVAHAEADGGVILEDLVDDDVCDDLADVALVADELLDALHRDQQRG